MGSIEADYLVIGAGATAMAFVDTLVSETSATVVIVDRNHQPGGHWTTAYPFVRLHQPSAYYGVNSRPLGSDTIDSAGLNEGFYELAGGRGGVRLLRRGHAAAPVADGAGLVLPDERVPRRRPDPHASAVTTSASPRAADRRHDLRRYHRAVDAAAAVRRRARRRLHTAERPAQPASLTTAT